MAEAVTKDRLERVAGLIRTSQSWGACLRALSRVQPQEADSSQGLPQVPVTRLSPGQILLLIFLRLVTMLTLSPYAIHTLLPYDGGITVRTSGQPASAFRRSAALIPWRTVVSAFTGGLPRRLPDTILGGLSRHRGGDPSRRGPRVRYVPSPEPSDLYSWTPCRHPRAIRLTPP